MSETNPKIQDIKKIRVCFHCGSLYPKGKRWCPYCCTRNKFVKEDMEWLKIEVEKDFKEYLIKHKERMGRKLEDRKARK